MQVGDHDVKHQVCRGTPVPPTPFSVEPEQPIYLSHLTTEPEMLTTLVVVVTIKVTIFVHLCTRFGSLRVPER